MPILPTGAGAGYQTPKIIYPSAPPVPALPSLSSAPGGSRPATTYYVKQSYNTAYGEGVASAEQSLAVPANSVLVVTSPAAVSAANIPNGWFNYVGTAPGGETLQPPNPISLGANWTEPTSGLTGGGRVPFATWPATTLNFVYPPRQIPYASYDSRRTKTESYAGFPQTLAWYSLQVLPLNMEDILAGADVAAWKAFLDWAIAAGPFDYYPNSSGGAFTTYFLDDDKPQLAFKHAGMYSLKANFRQWLF